jgi:hypothetical protein
MSLPFAELWAVLAPSLLTADWPDIGKIADTLRQTSNGSRVVAV